MASGNVVFDAPFVGSSNVTSLSYNVDANGALSYSSGGIPQYYAVVPDTSSGNSRDITLPDGNNTVPILGVLQDGPAITAGQSGQVRVMGITKAVAHAAITYGQLVITHSDGTFKPAAAAGATNTFVAGVALTAATEIGDIFELLLLPGATQYVAS